MTEPKPVVLPLHHDPIALQKYDILFTPASLPALFSTKSTIFLFSSRKRQQKHAHKLPPPISWAQNFRPRLSTPEIEKTTSEVIIFISEVVVFISEVNSSPSYFYFFLPPFSLPLFLYRVRSYLHTFSFSRVRARYYIESLVFCLHCLHQKA